MLMADFKFCIEGNYSKGAGLLINFIYSLIIEAKVAVGFGGEMEMPSEPVITKNTSEMRRAERYSVSNTV